MPELPEVENICRKLHLCLTGGTIVALEVLKPEMIRNADERKLKALKGQRIRGVKRQGKMVTIEVGNSHLLIFHLKMTGKLFIRPERCPDRYCHIIIHGQDSSGQDFFLHFHDMRRFGHLCLLPLASAAHSPPLNRLGPDALFISINDFIKVIRSTSRRIKPLLLDQTRIAGLGNIYVDEILFKSGINPLTSAKDVSSEKISSLYKAMKEILREAIEKGGSTVRDYLGPTGKKGSFQQKHAVYRRKGSTCLVCSDMIIRITVAGRGTYFCPTCQKMP